MNPMLPIKDLIPNRQIKINISTLVAIVFIFISLGIGYGGYKAGYDNQGAQIITERTEITHLKESIDDLTYKLGRLEQSMEDLKDSLDRKR